jgi:hypothetical protein
MKYGLARPLSDSRLPSRQALRSAIAPRVGQLVPVLGLMALVASAACLPDDPKVNARLLVAGSDITNPNFVMIDDEPWVLYEKRRARPWMNRGGIVDLHLVKWADGEQQRPLLLGRAERPEWPLVADSTGARFYVTDEKLTPGALPFGTLHRVTLKDGVVETLPDVMTYALGSTGRTFHYRKFVLGSALAELHLRHLDGRDRNFGFVAPGQILLVREDTMYFIVGPERMLTRVSGFDGQAEPLRARVSQYQLGPGEKFALLTVADDAGKPRTIVYDFASKKETSLPVDNPCCWLRVDESTFTFAESAKAGQPAVLHTFNFMTGEDRTLVMPEGLNDIVSVVGRSRHDESLIFDTRGNMAQFRPAADPPLRLLSLRPRTYQFSPDGKYFFFMVVDPPPPPPAVISFPSGRLFVQNPDDWDEPPRLLSPVGASVPVEPKGYLVRDEGPYPLVFWARYGLGASDLYLGDHETGTNVLVAQGIGEVSVSHSQVLGVLNMSQDLTGELVYRDFVANKQIVIERGVFEVEYLRDRSEIVFTIRERMPSSPRNGLWATMLPSSEELEKQERFVPTVDLDSQRDGQGEAGLLSPNRTRIW